MNQNSLKSNIGKITQKKRRGVGEVISTLLLVAITVVGAVILTTFLDESFVAGSTSVISGTDSTLKTIKLRGYDTRNGEDLMDPLYALDNDNLGVPDVLCRITCSGSPETYPTNGGSDFMVIQIQNRGVDSMFLKNIYIDNVSHPWDPDTFNIDLDATAPTSAGGSYPSDGRFSVLSQNPADTTQGRNEVRGGETVNLLIKLDTVNPDLELSKTTRVEINIGESSMPDFLIVTGDAR